MANAPETAMHSERPRVLLVDDESPVRRLLRRWIEDDACEVIEAEEPAALSRALEREPACVLLDLGLGDGCSGLAMLNEIRSRWPDAETIVMTGRGSVGSAVECMRAGAFDYLEKPFEDRDQLAFTLERALERRRLRVQGREVAGAPAPRSALERMVARSAAMQRVVRTVRDLSRSESNVLIQAESGTGKELLARAIHETSPRAGGAFVPVDCGALPEGIAEGELFGYERGAFTGAVRASTGLFRAANAGTLFLDEIGELPLSLQSKLLRALQEREVRPLGARDAESIDVRVIAATNRDLSACVRAGTFRADLFYRLRVVSLALPRLRERPEDIAVLAMEFIARAARRGSRVVGLEPDALAELRAHDWPGNVRELENAIEAAVALAGHERLSARDLQIGDGRARVPAPRADQIELSLAAYERACLIEALRRTEGDVPGAARLLGVGRSTLYRKLVRHGLRRD